MAARAGKKHLITYISAGMPVLKYIISLLCLLVLFSCSVQKQAGAIAKRDLLDDEALASAHTGIAIYDPASARYLYDFQGSRYFTPASNTKIFTCYAAMKYLKHILTGMRYYENDTAIYLVPTGDPSLLHAAFPNQPVIRFLQQQQKQMYITDLNFREEPLGEGWSWDDYNEPYMAERNALPVYGNMITWVQEEIKSAENSAEKSASVYSDPEINWKVRFDADPRAAVFNVKRDRNENIFHITEGKERYKKMSVPFVVNGIRSALELLADTVRKTIRFADHFTVPNPKPQAIWSQPTDSLLKPMMYRSDNFFAEQLLLMVSEQQLGVMNNGLIIGTILKTDLKDLPQPPAWVDGSGLSRYNLFSPRDFITVLDKMRAEFGMNRIRGLFPTGGQGTLSGYYVRDSGYIYAKTGSLSGVATISGYLYTKKNRLLIFSVMVNNHLSGTAAIRKKVERFVKDIREKF